MKVDLVSNGKTTALYVDGEFVVERRGWISDSEVLHNVVSSVNYSRTKQFRGPYDDFPQFISDVVLD